MATALGFSASVSPPGKLKGHPWLSCDQEEDAPRQKPVLQRVRAASLPTAVPPPGPWPHVRVPLGTTTLLSLGSPSRASIPLGGIDPGAPVTPSGLSACLWVPWTLFPTAWQGWLVFPQLSNSLGRRGLHKACTLSWLAWTMCPLLDWEVQTCGQMIEGAVGSPNHICLLKVLTTSQSQKH